MKRIIYLRSTAIFNDSRASKEISCYTNENNKVIVLGWNRRNDKVTNSKVKYDLFELSSNYGDGIKNIFKLLKFEKWLTKKLKHYINDYDIIHACDFDTAYVASKIAKKYHKKLIYDIYDYYVDCHNLYFMKKIVEKKDINIINNADCVLICTEQRREQINKANPKMLEVIHNTPEIEKNFEKKNFDAKKIKICYVGILWDNRLLTEISSEIIKHPNIEFHVGGFGKYQEYFEKIAKENKNIYFYGQMKYEKVLELESNCDVLFATYNPKFSNHKYCAPNKVYEAMALGKPIIVCKDTGIDELVIKNDIGFCIKYDAKEFIETVLNLENVNMDKYYKNNKKIYSEKYSWNIMKKKLLKIIKNI